MEKSFRPTPTAEGGAKTQTKTLLVREVWKETNQRHPANSSRDRLPLASEGKHSSGGREVLGYQVVRAERAITSAKGGLLTKLGLRRHLCSVGGRGGVVRRGS